MKRAQRFVMEGVAIAALLSLLLVSCQQPEVTAPADSPAVVSPLAKVDVTPRLYVLGVVPDVEGPDIAAASDGATITIVGSGTLIPMPKSVTGSGTFVHKNSSGAVLATGTWTATQLITFVSYGTLPAPDENLEGGKANIRIHLTPSSGGGGLDGVLQVHCLLGSFPAGVDEGIRLNVQGGPNFNREVHGETVFIK